MPCLSQLFADRRGSAAIEFAFIFPVLLMILFGTIELTNMIMNERRVVSASQSLADLVARHDAIAPATLADLENAVRWQLEPFDANDANYTVGQVLFSGGTPAIDWTYSVGSNNTISTSELVAATAGLTTTGGVIVVQFEYDYTPMVGQLILADGSAVTLTQTALSYPRLSASVSCDSCP